MRRARCRRLCCVRTGMPLGSGRLHEQRGMGPSAPTARGDGGLRGQDTSRSGVYRRDGSADTARLGVSLQCRGSGWPSRPQAPGAKAKLSDLPLDAIVKNAHLRPEVLGCGPVRLCKQLPCRSAAVASHCWLSAIACSASAAARSPAFQRVATATSE